MGKGTANKKRALPGKLRAKDGTWMLERGFTEIPNHSGISNARRKAWEQEQEGDLRENGPCPKKKIDKKKSLAKLPTWSL